MIAIKGTIQYRVYDKEAQEYASHDAIILQDGRIAWWNSSVGWAVDDNQDRYEVYLAIRRKLDEG